MSVGTPSPSSRTGNLNSASENKVIFYIFINPVFGVYGSNGGKSLPLNVGDD